MDVNNKLNTSSVTRDSSDAVFNKLKVITLNIRSLNAHFDDLLLFTRDKGLDILALTETWISEDDAAKFSISGYRMFIQSRVGKRSAGVVLFIRENLCVHVSYLNSSYYNGIKASFSLEGGRIFDFVCIYIALMVNRLVVFCET